MVVEATKSTAVKKEQDLNKECHTVVMDVPEIIGLYNVKSILTDNSI